MKNVIFGVICFCLGGVFTGELIKARIAASENFKQFGAVYRCERVTEHLAGKNQK